MSADKASGFLHQLAARSLGLAPQVKPRAALPYAATAALAGEPEVTGSDVANTGPAAALPSHGETRGEATSRLPEPLLPPNETRPTQQRANTGAGLPTTNDRERQQARPPLSPSPRLQPASHHKPFDDEIGDRANGHELMRSRRPLPEALTATPPPGISNRHEKSPVPDEPGTVPLPDLESLVARLFEQRQNTDTAPEAPEALTKTGATQAARLDPPRTESGVTIRPPTLPQPAAPARETDAAPEVHITIGRLEVNAPNKPPPPPPARPRGPAPLSLSDYLARRQGSRS